MLEARPRREGDSGLRQWGQDRERGEKMADMVQVANWL